MCAQPRVACMGKSVKKETPQVDLRRLGRGWFRAMGSLADDFLDLLQEVIAAIFAEFLGVLFSFLHIGVLENRDPLEMLIEDTPVEFHSRLGSGLPRALRLGFYSGFRGGFSGFRGLLRLL
jgi:hypothetical protein